MITKNIVSAEEMLVSIENKQGTPHFSGESSHSGDLISCGTYLQGENKTKEAE